MVNYDVQPETAGQSAVGELTRPRRCWLAGLLSLIRPGLGQLYGGNVPRAMFVYLLDGVLGCLAVVLILYLPIAALNVWLAAAIYFGYVLLAVVDAGLQARRKGKMVLQPWQRWWVYLVVWLGTVILSQGVAYGSRAVWAEAFVMPGGGMTNTILPGDRIVADKLHYWLAPMRRGDIIVFRVHEPESIVSLKRIVALPDDTVEIRDEKLFVNGQPVDEPYATFEGPISRIDGALNFGPHQVADGELFALGDNRRLSHDSRFRGDVPIADVIGRVTTIYQSMTVALQTHPRAQTPSTTIKPGRIRWSRIGLRLDDD
jgi:signal peptidase I